MPTAIPDAEDARYTVTYQDGDTVLKQDTVLTGMNTPGLRPRLKRRACL